MNDEKAPPAGTGETVRLSRGAERPLYADFDPPAKFTAIQSIIAKHLKLHPKAICSYSGGSDSDTLIDLVERAREMFNLAPVRYVFFNTGLELRATREHVKATAQKYGVEIEEHRPKINIVQSARNYGIPFMSKLTSQALDRTQIKNMPLSIAVEYAEAEDKPAKYRELKERYQGCVWSINYLCCCDSRGESKPVNQLCIDSAKYLRDFIAEFPPDFRISAKCCDHCKKQLAHSIQKNYDMVITGERKVEGGARAVKHRSNVTGCFNEMRNGQFRLRPLYYVTDKDKAWYKEYYGLRYSDAYEVYGLTRTGCCGCPISYKATADLEKIRPYEPNVVKAAWAIFGKSYEYRRKYNDYKAARMAAERSKKDATLDLFGSNEG